jgi:ferritin-like protein
MTENGVVEELARDDVERKRFLKMAGKSMGAGAAATALGAFIAACGSSSSSSSSSSAPAASTAATTATTAASGSGDLTIVNYALTLEYLEDEFYSKVIASGLFNGSTLSTLKTFGAEEHQHVLALEGVAKSLGTPAPKPKGKFPLGSAASVAKLAATVENLGAAAYLGQAGNIKSKEILAAALSIHTVEARHAAVLNTLLKLSPTPDGPFAKPMSMADVLAAVKPFIA